MNEFNFKNGAEVGGETSDSKAEIRSEQEIVITPTGEKQGAETASLDGVGNVNKSEGMSLSSAENGGASAEAASASESEETVALEQLDQNGQGATSDGGETGKKKKKKKKGKYAKMFVAYPLQTTLYVLYKVFTYLLNVLLTISLVGIITGIAVCVAFVVYVKNYIDPSFDGLNNLQFDSSLATSIYYVDESGNEIELVDDKLSGSENRLWATYDELPQQLIDAYIAIEDKRFWEHPGIDYRRTANAFLNFFSSSGDGSGGSTITQQLIKNVSGEDDVTIQRKMQEILRAITVTKQFSKQQIIEMYLNTIFLSQNSYGVKTAAETYFGKELDELTLVECAALASIPKSPTKYDPIRNPQHNLERRNLVLDEMLDQGRISQAEHDEAYNAQLDLNTDSTVNYEEKIRSYFMDALIDEVIADLKEEFGYDSATASRVLYSGGLQIITTLDPDVQKAMETVFEDTTNKYLYVYGDTVDDVKGVIAQSAMVVMDPDTGNVLGIVGGRGEKTTSRGLNRATQSVRQCGSAIKPLSLYTLAIDKGLITAGSAVDDVPTMRISEKYWPTNTPNKFYGHISVNFAVMKSLNTVPVQLVNELTPKVCFDFLTDTLGFYSPIESVKVGGQTHSDINIAPMALGAFTYGVTVKEMTQGYCMLANGGKTSDARLYTEIRDRQGNILISKDENHKVAVSEQSAYLMTSVLQNVITNPTATGRRVTLDDEFEIEVAGKTGSTNDNRDIYFAAYTPEYVGAVWFGYDNNKSLSGYSINPALSLWDNVFKLIYQDLEEKGVEYEKQFTEPAGIVEVEYCTVSGKLATADCYKDAYYYDVNKNTFTGSCVEKGAFAVGTQPTEKCDCHVKVLWDKTTRAICFDGCTCPESDLIELSFRRDNEREFESYVSVADGQFIYKDIPLGYVFPTSEKVPFFNNLYGEKTYFGISSSVSKPWNRICIEHYNPNQPETESETGEESNEPASESSGAVGESSTDTADNSNG